MPVEGGSWRVGERDCYSGVGIFRFHLLLFSFFSLFPSVMVGHAPVPPSTVQASFLRLSVAHHGRVSFFGN